MGAEGEARGLQDAAACQEADDDDAGGQQTDDGVAITPTRTALLSREDAEARIRPHVLDAPGQAPE